MLYELRQIDPVRDADGNWYWNDSTVLRDEIVLDNSESPHYVLKWIRDNGYLPFHSKGHMRVEYVDDLIEIQLKDTRMPLLALRPA